jgi:hypothetical protein
MQKIKAELTLMVHAKFLASLSFLTQAIRSLSTGLIWQWTASDWLAALQVAPPCDHWQNLQAYIKIEEWFE